MKRKTTVILTTLLCLAPILLGLYLYDQLPEMVPTHFNANWEPDGWSSRTAAVFGIPCMMAAINLLCHWAFERMKKQDGERKVAPEILMELCFWIPGLISVTMVPMTLFMAIGVEFPMGRILNLVLGLTLAFAGNYMPKCKMNPYIGLKFPWTYSSDENWHRTHRLGGFCWVVAGLLMLVNAVIDSVIITTAVVTAAILIPGVYSFLIYRKEKQQENG